MDRPDRCATCRVFAAIAEGMGGLRHVTGFPDRPPVRSGISIGDTLASLYGVIGALMALHNVRVNGGAGQVVDVALYEAVFAVMESLNAGVFSAGGVIRGGRDLVFRHLAFQHVSLPRRRLRESLRLTEMRSLSAL